MAVLGALNVLSSVDSKGFDRGCKSMSQSAGGLESSLGKLGGVFAGVFAAEKLIAGGKHLLELASTAQEMNSKLAVVWKGQTEQVTAWADATGAAVGRGSNVIRTMVADMGALLSPMELGKERTLEMSQAITQLAVDIGSFHNASDDEALLALRSGILGESEPLKKYGILLNEAKTKTELLRMGVQKINGEYTDADKIQARYNLIISQTKDVQGDAARTIDSFSNSSKSAAGKWTDIGTAIGSAFIPAATAATQVLVEMADGLTHAWDGLSLFGTGLDATTMKLEGIALDKKIAALQAKQKKDGSFEAKDTSSLQNLGTKKFSESSSVNTTNQKALGESQADVEARYQGLSKLNVERQNSLKLLDDEYNKQQIALLALRGQTDNAGELNKIQKDLNGLQAQYTREVNATNEAYNSLERSSLALDIRDQSEAMKEQIATFGMTNEQVAIYALQQKAAALTDKDAAKAMLQKIEGLKGQQTELAKLEKAEKDKERLKAVKASLDPLSDFKKQAKEMAIFFDEGKLSKEQLLLGVGNLKDQLTPDKEASQMQYAGAYDINTKEARSAILNQQRTEPTKKALKEAEKQSKIQTAMEKALRQIAAATGVEEIIKL